MVIRKIPGVIILNRIGMNTIRFKLNKCESQGDRLTVSVKRPCCAWKVTGHMEDFYLFNLYLYAYIHPWTTNITTKHNNAKIVLCYLILFVTISRWLWIYWLFYDTQSKCKRAKLVIFSEKYIFNLNIYQMFIV